MAAAGTAIGRIALLGVVATALLGWVGVAAATPTDNGVLNQLEVADTGSLTGSGAAFSSMTVTSYTDGSISFAVQFANRTYLQTGATVQFFIDLDGNGQADLNLSIWPSFDPSYLARWTGSSWANIRQLPELVQAPGSISVRLSLAELRSDAAVPLGSTINVAVGSYAEDANGNVPNTPNDAIPSATGWTPFSIDPPPPGQAGTTTAATTTPAKRSVPAHLPSNTTDSALPVSIERIAPIVASRDEDVTLHIVLKSRPGPYRLFKVCASVPASAGVPNPTQCRSEQSAGGAGALPFTITYVFDRLETVHVSIAASAGAAKASAAAVVHVSKL